VVDSVLMPLTELCFDKALHVRHGAVLGVSEVVIGLSGNSIVNRRQALEKAFKTLSISERNIIKEETENQKKFQLMYQEVSSKDHLADVLKAEDCKLICSLVEKIEEKKLYRGKGGEIMRAGVCHLIHALSTARMKLDNKTLQ
jgi:hypothetical protein